jgi:hypothetical protein
MARGIKHWGLSGYSGILPRIKFYVTGQESSTQSPTILYRRPLWAIASSRKRDSIMIVLGIGKARKDNIWA